MLVVVDVLETAVTVLEFGGVVLADVVVDFVLGLVVLDVVEVEDDVLEATAATDPPNWTTLPSPKSATQRYPLESTARPVGWFSLVAVGEVTGGAELAVKFGWPSTRLAASNVERGDAYSRTLLLSLSETQRLPLESKASPSGLFIPVAEATVLLFVKLFWPITTLAPSWVVRGAGYSSTLCPSATHRFPLESKATELGALSPALATWSLLVVKLGSPTTVLAA